MKLFAAKFRTFFILMLAFQLIITACDADKSKSENYEWQEVFSSQGEHINSIIGKDSMIFAAMRIHGVLASADSGKTWNEKNTGITDFRIEALVRDDSAVYAGAYELYLFRTMDNGNTWTDVNLGLSHIFGSLTSLAVRNSTLFVGTLEHGVSYSTDRGEHWNRVNNNALKYVKTLFVDGDTVYAGTYNGIYICPANDSVWVPLINELSDAVITALGKSGTNLFIGTNTGIGYKYTASGELTEISDVLPENSHYSFCGYSENIFAGLYGNGVYFSTNSGAHWTNISDELSGATVLSIAVIDSTVFVGSENNIHMISLNEVIGK